MRDSVHASIRRLDRLLAAADAAEPLARGGRARRGYGLLFLSGAHAKTAAVQAEYRSLHPLLRMATATLVALDGDLLVTDASRSADDYAGMGLTANEASLHLPQRDGYAHALDLRTIGRSRIRNALIRAYFAALGFRTLRHTDTADHLHVSLPLP